jgi:hypothetical protein
MTDGLESNIQGNMNEVFLDLENALWNAGIAEGDEDVKTAFNTMKELEAAHPENEKYGLPNTDPKLSGQYGFEFITRWNKLDKREERFGYGCHHCSSYIAKGKPLIIIKKDKKISTAKELTYICQLCSFDLQDPKQDLHDIIS